VGKRKRRGRGGIRKVKGRDLYVGRYTVETETGSTKRRAIYHKDYEEVERLLNEALADRGKGLVFDAGAMTLGEYMNRWLVRAQEPGGRRTRLWFALDQGRIASSGKRRMRCDNYRRPPDMGAGRHRQTPPI
jgi:hypothetical protein